MKDSGRRQGGSLLRVSCWSEYVCRCGMRASVCFLSGFGFLTSPCWAGPGPLEGSWPRRKGCELRAALPLNSPPSEGALLVCASGSGPVAVPTTLPSLPSGCTRAPTCCPPPLGCDSAAFLTAWASASCHQALALQPPQSPRPSCCAHPSPERQRRPGGSPGVVSRGPGPGAMPCGQDKKPAGRHQRVLE